MYTLEQNGVVERKNRTIMEATRAMLHDQGLPKFLWREVANIVVYVQNRCPHQALDTKTPEEIFTGKKPDVSHFRILKVPYIFMRLKKREASWMLLERREHLWDTMKIQRHTESTCLVKGKWP